MQCGGTLEQFELLTLRDCLDFIITYVNINNKKNNKQDQSHQSSSSFPKSDTLFVASSTPLPNSR
jgi:hypothetical protein